MTLTITGQDQTAGTIDGAGEIDSAALARIARRWSAQDNRRYLAWLKPWLADLRRKGWNADAETALAQISVDPAIIGRWQDLPAPMGDICDDLAIVARFLRSCTEPDAAATVNATKLYIRFAQWTAVQPAIIISQRQFGRLLAELGVEREKAGSVFYRGIALIQPPTDA